MKLSDILELMANGWELAKSGGAESRWWLQEGGACKGGKTKTVRYDYIYRLEKSGKIRELPPTKNQQYWLTKYELVKSK